MQTVTLKSGREEAIQRYSPWVFSGAIARQDEGIADGDTVRVNDKAGTQVGIGHYQEGSIRVRMLQFGAEPFSEDVIDRRLAAALRLRSGLGLAADTLTNAYRLVHAAGDGLPGLIVDRYAGVAVVQCHSIGMHRQRERIAAALLATEGIDSVYDKSATVLPDRYGNAFTNGTLAGEQTEQIRILENGRRFVVDLVSGQKTGFFLDQRDNRWLLGSYARDRRVLNTFCYTGGFSVYALLGGAAQVQSVDLSERAVGMADTNVAENGDFADRHSSHVADVLEFLGDVEPGSFDIVVVDPPAYAKNKHRRHKAVQAYKRLNARAMRALAPGGLLFTFSCSRVVDTQLFRNTIVAAGLETGRSVRVLHRLAQGPDHPVSLYHAEGEYLKGLVLQVD